MRKIGDHTHSFIKERHAVLKARHGSRPAGRFLISADEKQTLFDGWLRCVQRREKMNGRVLSHKMEESLVVDTADTLATSSVAGASSSYSRR